jgi:hypothetical protein
VEGALEVTNVGAPEIVHPSPDIWTAAYKDMAVVVLEFQETPEMIHGRRRMNMDLLVGIFHQKFRVQYGGEEGSMSLGWRIDLIVEEQIVQLVHVETWTEEKVADRVMVLENGGHTLVNCTKRMTAFEVSIFGRKNVVVKSSRPLVTQTLLRFPHFALKDGGLKAESYCGAHLACNANKLSLVLLFNR